MQLCIPHNLLVIGAEVLWSICHGASLVGHSLLHTWLGEPLQKIVLMKIRVVAAPDIRCWLLVQWCELVNGGVGPFLVMPMAILACAPTYNELGQVEGKELQLIMYNCLTAFFSMDPPSHHVNINHATQCYLSPRDQAWTYDRGWQLDAQ